MRYSKMQSAKGQSRGFTLIASLMLMLLMSAVAIGLLMMVNTESRVGNSDLENTAAYHSAEGAMEKMASDLNSMYANILAPSVQNIQNLNALKPTNNPLVTYPDYTLTPHTKPDGTPNTGWGPITAGAYKDLYAQILQVDLLATAQRPLGDQVSMMRTVEVAMIPVFQFGVFSDSDLGFYSSPDLDFAGRVHTNGDLYLGVANGNTLTFHDKITAYGDVIRQQLPNGLDASSNNDGGTVNILTAAQGCDSNPRLCRSMGQNEGSVTAGAGSSANSSWQTISTSSSYYNSWIIDGDWGKGNGTGVKPLNLPFVQGTTQPYQIIRRPPTGESATSVLGASRLYNQAQIRVLLADSVAELPGGATDTANIRLANVDDVRPGATALFSDGVTTTTMAGLPALAAGATYNTFFAEGSNAIPSLNLGLWDWPNPPLAGTQPLKDYQGNNTTPIFQTKSAALPALSFSATSPYYIVPAANTITRWNLIDGYLRVEIRKSDGTYAPVTKEWLQLGFARGLAVPNGVGTNPINPKAILILQKLADRNENGLLDAGAANKPAELFVDPVSNSPYYGSSKDLSAVNAGQNHLTRTNWYPINFYDAREGEMRDNVRADQSCSVNGVMNAVEVDVANLRDWLRNSATGQTVESASQNGYILYFSDRRGMLPNPNNGNIKEGEFGFEDVINSAAGGGLGAAPDGSLENVPPNKVQSPEDVNFNGKLDNYGAADLGLGFNTPITTNPYVRLASCPLTARKNWVSGARHVLKLVDGNMGSLPRRVQPDGTDAGGFTVAAENPVYVQGDYNTNSTDPTWTTPPGAEPPHASAAVIADAVTLLSNAWSESMSFDQPSDANSSGARPAVSTRYRLAIAAGKTINFPNPSWSGGVLYGFGTDGGLHNFLRFLENWGNDALYYKGSLVSLYYSTYNTGTFKCCGYSVYQPPDRNYIFDPLFSRPDGLPPGTPSFRDVENLSYHQTFTARTN
jgi:type II secretory pathway pseudopilin PulG